MSHFPRPSMSHSLPSSTTHILQLVMSHFPRPSMSHSLPSSTTHILQLVMSHFPRPSMSHSLLYHRARLTLCDHPRPRKGILKNENSPSHESASILSPSSLVRMNLTRRSSVSQCSVVSFVLFKTGLTGR